MSHNPDQLNPLSIQPEKTFQNQTGQQESELEAYRVQIENQQRELARTATIRTQLNLYQQELVTLRQKAADQAKQFEFEIIRKTNLIGALQDKVDQAEQAQKAQALEIEALKAQVLWLEQVPTSLPPGFKGFKLNLQDLQATATRRLSGGLKRLHTLQPYRHNGQAHHSPTDSVLPPSNEVVIVSDPINSPPELSSENDSPISGSIDTPLVNTLIKSSLLVVEGWAYSTTGNIAKLDVFLDDELIGRASSGFERPDVAGFFSVPGMANCGFGGKFVLKPFETYGPKKLRVHILDQAGNSQQLIQPVIFEKSTIEMSLDEPVMGMVTAGVVTVSGWAFSWEAAISSIQVLIGGNFFGTIHHGITRQDGISKTGYAGSERSGFWGIINFPPEVSRKETLTIRAIDTLGNLAETIVEINFKLAAEPVAEIEQVSWQAGMLHLEGYALWPVSQAPRYARLFVDGEFAGQVSLMLSRPDIQRRFPTNPTAARSGFKINLPLVPAKEPARHNLHEILVEFVDGEGRYFQQKSHVHYEPFLCQLPYPELWNRFIDEYKDRFGHEPAILDWTTSLNLATVFPGHNIFPASTSYNSRILPYIDQSIDLVTVAEGDPDRLAEAERVAISGVIIITAFEDPPNLNTLLSAPAGSGSGEWEPGGIFNSFRIKWRSEELATKTRLPGASIIIPTYNRADLVNNCLEQLVATIPFWLKVEIIVIDDASSDDTNLILESWSARDSRVRAHRNSQNAGFLRSCNQGAAAAGGEVLIFLNNDTVTQPGWLSPLLRTIVDYPDAGAVGGKLIYPNGLLQEAGGIIFADAAGWNLGRGSYDMDAPIYNYFREVDYCSGALLATRRQLFEELGGFDTRFAPMYYEDVDYCFTLRQKGYKVYYQPESVIIHLEGGTAGTDTAQGFKAWQVVNRDKFIEKWEQTLKRQPPHPEELTFKLALDLAVRNEKYNPGPETNIGLRAEHIEVEPSVEPVKLKDSVGTKFQPIMEEINPYQISLFCEDFNPHKESFFDEELNTMITKVSLEKKVLQGWCNVTAQRTEFAITQSNLREDVVAGVSGSINRQRQMVCGLSMGLFRHPFAGLPEITRYINDNNLRLYTAEANSVFFNQLKENIRPELFFYSEFFGSEYRSGEIVNGIMHQDLQKTSFEDEVFDIILSSEVFEHISDAVTAEREVIRILKKGGIYCFTVPFAPAATEDIVLADLDERGNLRYYQEPQYHGDPVRPDQGILVFRVFSYDGMKARFEKLDCTFKTFRLWSETLGIIGENCFLHLITRN